MTSHQMKSMPEAEVKDLPPLLRALWFDLHGDWEAAHSVAQNVPGRAAAQMHAYLHRKEGDEGNAGYWYRQAGVKPFKGTLDAEWEMLAQEVTGQ